MYDNVRGRGCLLDVEDKDLCSPAPLEETVIMKHGTGITGRILIESLKLDTKYVHSPIFQRGLI